MAEKIEKLLGAALQARGVTIGTAESCTGGMIAARLTDTAGSSAYMLGGIVAYSNAIKERLLNVQTQTLIDYGAVSQQVAAEMAQGAQTALGADYALSVTGVAGPSGGTIQKPVGLTYIGLALPGGVVIVGRYIWPGDRAQNREASVLAALDLAYQHVR